MCALTRSIESTQESKNCAMYLLLAFCVAVVPRASCNGAPRYIEGRDRWPLSMR